jgi:hypothetical protein
MHAGHSYAVELALLTTRLLHAIPGLHLQLVLTVVHITQLHYSLGRQAAAVPNVARHLPVPYNCLSQINRDRMGTNLLPSTIVLELSVDNLRHPSAVEHPASYIVLLVPIAAAVAFAAGRPSSNMTSAPGQLGPAASACAFKGVHLLLEEHAQLPTRPRYRAGSSWMHGRKLPVPMAATTPQFSLRPRAASAGPMC